MARTKRDKRTNNTKERLALKAIRLFWLYGYSDVSIDQIAKAAKAQKGSVYYFFPSKLELLQECTTLMNTHINKKLAEIESQSISPYDAVLSYYNWLIEKQVQAKRKYGFIPGFLHMSVGATTLHQSDMLSSQIDNYHHDHQAKIQLLLDSIEHLQEPDLVNAETLNYLFTGAVWKARITNSSAPLEGALNSIRTLLTPI